MPTTSISENILLLICGAGMLQAILLAGILYFKPRSDRSVTGLLALYITCLFCPLLFPFTQFFLPWQVNIFLGPTALLPGPFLYLYVRSFKEVITFRKAFPHFLIFILFILIVGIIVNTYGDKYPRTPNIPAELLQNPVTIVPITIRFLQMFLYYTWARKTLASYQRSIQHLFSETSRINLNWVKWLINGFLVLISTSTILYVLVLRTPDNFDWFILVNSAVFTPYIYMATIKGLGQLTLWQVQPGANREMVEKEMNAAEKLDTSIKTEAARTKKRAGADGERIQEIASRIVEMMTIEKIYQDTELTLQDLADKLNLPAYQVSMAINEGMNKNFYDLVNGYRVEEAKRLLLDDSNRNYTILSIGFEAGFNSKTTFNTVFKKFTGQTPTAFKTEHSKSFARA